MGMTKTEVIDDVKSTYHCRFIYHRDRENVLFDSGMDENQRDIHSRLMDLAYKIKSCYDGFSNGEACEAIAEYIKLRRLVK
jgi:hypothetical protein